MSRRSKGENWVVLVEPEYSGNIGSVARVMANFGFKNLALVNPKCPINLETRKYAMHAWPIVEQARRIDFDDVFGLGDFVVGTTAKPGVSSTRSALTPRELGEFSRGKDASFVFVFGRESRGLTNDELRKCDIALTIPTSREYKSMNLSHAVAIVLYEMYLARQGGRSHVPKVEVDKREKDSLIALFEDLAYHPSLGLRNPENAVKMFRNVISRAIIVGREARAISGVISGALEAIDALWGEGGGEGRGRGSIGNQQHKHK